MPHSTDELVKFYPQEGQAEYSEGTARPQEGHGLVAIIGAGAVRCPLGVPQCGQKATSFPMGRPQFAQRSGSDRLVPQLEQNTDPALISEPHDGHVHFLIGLISGIDMRTSFPLSSIERASAPAANMKLKMPAILR